jgi:hypothetical protein
MAPAVGDRAEVRREGERRPVLQSTAEGRARFDLCRARAALSDSRHDEERFEATIVRTPEERSTPSEEFGKNPEL